jgi:transposase
MTSMQIGVDLAKSVFEVAVSTVPGRVHERRRLSRAALGPFFAQRPPAEVLLEACGSAHHWGRELQRLGHRVTLLHPRDVARYRDGNKTDRAGPHGLRGSPANVLAMSCKARLVMLASSYPLGRALPAPWRG